MADLNIESTKAAFVKELKALEAKKQSGKLVLVHSIAQDSLIDVAKELEIEIKAEDYKLTA